jgi:hypothetical protein
MVEGEDEVTIGTIAHEIGGAIRKQAGPLE